MRLCLGFYRDRFVAQDHDLKQIASAPDIASAFKTEGGLVKLPRRRMRIAVDAERIVCIKETDKDDTRELVLGAGGSIFVSNPLDEAIELWLSALAQEKDTVQQAREALEEASAATEVPDDMDGFEEEPNSDRVPLPENPLPEPMELEMG